MRALSARRKKEAKSLKGLSGAMRKLAVSEFLALPAVMATSGNDEFPASQAHSHYSCFKESHQGICMWMIWLDVLRLGSSRTPLPRQSCCSFQP